jgi:DNA-binding MarR family transcriptional regulator
MNNVDISASSTTTPGIRRPALLAWLRLARVFAKIDRSSQDELRCSGLSLAQFDVLAHVGASEGMTQQELADALLVTKGNVCQLLDRMERSGLIERQQDGRSNRLFPTAEGRSMFVAVVPHHEDRIAEKFNVLSHDEQRELLRLLKKLDRALD